MSLTLATSLSTPHRLLPTPLSYTPSPPYHPHPTHPPCFSPTLLHSLLRTHTLHSSLFAISYTLPPFPITHTLPPLPSPPLSHSLISPVTHTLPPLPSPPIPPLTVSTMTALSLHLSTTVVMVRQTTSRPRMTPRARRSFQSFKAWLGRREHRQHKLSQEATHKRTLTTILRKHYSINQ